MGDDRAEHPDHYPAPLLSHGGNNGDVRVFVSIHYYAPCDCGSGAACYGRPVACGRHEVRYTKGDALAFLQPVRLERIVGSVIFFFSEP